MTLERATLRALVIVSLWLLGSCAHDGTWSCDLVARPGEFELLILPNIVVTSRLTGLIEPRGGGEWLPQNEPSMEISRQGAGEAEMRVIKLGLQGTIPPTELAPGRYCYRATARGFSSVGGRLEIRKGAEARDVMVTLPLAN